MAGQVKENPHEDLEYDRGRGQSRWAKRRSTAKKIKPMKIPKQQRKARAFYQIKKKYRN